MTTQIEDEVGAITFDVDDSTIQIHDGRIMIWTGSVIDKPDIDIDIEVINKILSTARMLIKEAP